MTHFFSCAPRMDADSRRLNQIIKNRRNLRQSARFKQTRIAFERLKRGDFQNSNLYLKILPEKKVEGIRR
jgi:hypothetical protein